jgi:hypothetical protein
LRKQLLAVVSLWSLIACAMAATTSAIDSVVEKHPVLEGRLDPGEGMRRIRKIEEIIRRLHRD